MSVLDSIKNLFFTSAKTNSNVKPHQKKRSLRIEPLEKREMMTVVPFWDFTDMSNVVLTEDFETFNDAPVHDNGKWGTTTDPGNGWETADENPHIEYQEEGLFGGFQAPSGSVWVELDAHYNNPGSTEISKEFTSEAGHLYRVSFALGVRPGTSVDQNKIGFTATSAAGETLYSQIYSADDAVSTEGLPAGWQWMVATFTATDANTKISFADEGVVNDTYGSLLDNVTVVDMTPVVSVETTDYYAHEPEHEHNEDDDFARFLVTRTGDTSGSLTVRCQFSGEAKWGATYIANNDWDYVLAAEGSDDTYVPDENGYLDITFAADESEIVLMVMPVDDDHSDSGEMVELTLLDPVASSSGVEYIVSEGGYYDAAEILNADYSPGIYFSVKQNLLNPGLLHTYETKFEPSSIKMTNELKVATWEAAKYNSNYTDVTNKDRKYNADRTINEQNFVAEDTDAFLVWVYDPTNNANTLQATIDTDIDDAANTITLAKSTKYNGWFVSDWQMLMADDKDDDLKVNGIADNAHNDCTHKISLGRQVTVTSMVGGASKEAKARVPIEVQMKKVFNVYYVTDTPTADGLHSGVIIMPNSLRKSKRISNGCEHASHKQGLTLQFLL